MVELSPQTIAFCPGGLSMRAESQTSTEALHSRQSALTSTQNRIVEREIHGFCIQEALSLNWYSATSLPGVCELGEVNSVFLRLGFFICNMVLLFSPYHCCKCLLLIPKLVWKNTVLRWIDQLIENKYASLTEIWSSTLQQKSFIFPVRSQVGMGTRLIRGNGFQPLLYY